MEIRVEGDQVIVVIAKGVRVMSRETFLEALKRGKGWKRQQAMAARMRPEGQRPQGGSCAAPDTGVVRL